MLSTSALLNESTVLARGSQETLCAALLTTSDLESRGKNETDQQRKRTSRLVATNHKINDVDWLQNLNEDITWIQGDPVHEISHQLNQNRRAGKTINQLHIIAHGSNGEVKLGNTLLTKHYLEESSELLQGWKLEAIYLWSCEAGRNTELIETLGKLTGAEVFSSNSAINRNQHTLRNSEGNRVSLRTLISQKELQEWNGKLSSPESNESNRLQNSEAVSDENINANQLGGSEDTNQESAPNAASTENVTSQDTSIQAKSISSLKQTNEGRSGIDSSPESPSIINETPINNADSSNSVQTTSENSGSDLSLTGNAETARREAQQAEAKTPITVGTLEELWHPQLQKWAAEGALSNAASEALHLDSSHQSDQLDALIARLTAGETSDIPPIELVQQEDMGGAMGAYATSNQTIYINNEWVQTASNVEAIKVLTEEYGHHLDALLNDTDTAGDEGQYFANLLIDTHTISNKNNYIRANDHGQIYLNGEAIKVEFSNTILDTNQQRLSFVLNQFLQPKAGDEIIYQNVISIDGQAVDAVYRVTELSSNIRIQDFDSETIDQHYISHFFVSSQAGHDYVKAEISFYKNGTYSGGSGDAVTLENVVINSYDIDERQYQKFKGITSYDLATNSGLTVTSNSDGVVTFSDETGLTTSNTEDETRVRVYYDSIDTFEIEMGTYYNGYTGLLYWLDFSLGINWEDPSSIINTPIDNTPPTIAISSDVSSLKAGETAAISFTLSESSTNFIESDITFSGGTLSNFSGSGTSYSATFTPTADSTTNGVIHVANDKFSDAASNNNQDASDANNTVTLTVDTIRPTIAISSDVSSLKAGETAAISFTLSESSTNFIESDITFSGGTLSNFSGSGTSYSATFTPTADSTTNGVIHVANDKFSDAASNNNQDESDANNTVTLTVDTIRPTIAISSDVSSLKAGETAAISFTLSESSTNFIESDITFSGGTLSNFSGSGTSYSATFTPTADSTTNGVIHVANGKFSDAASNNNQDESDANNTVTLTVDTTAPSPPPTPSPSPSPSPTPSPSPSPTPSPSPSPTPETSPSPTPDTTSEKGDVYLLLDTSTSMLHSAGKDHSKFQCLLTLEAFSKEAERAGYQFQRGDTDTTVTSTQLLQTLANQTSTQAIEELGNYTIIDNPNDAKNADNLDIHLITYNYHVQHNTFTLSLTNPNSGIDTMQAILSLKMAGEQFGNSINNNAKWAELGLPNPNRYDLYQGNPNKPSNLYAGTELLGALEGLDYLLNNKANDPNRRDQSTKISLILDGRPERRSWWDTRTSAASDSITGQAIPLPDSLGKEDITTSGLLYDTKGKPHYFKNNQGQWQWKEMQNNLNAALDLLAAYSNDPNNIQVNAYGLDNTGDSSLTAAYQDLFTNQTFDNTSGGWGYSHQIIQSLQDINF